MVNLFYLVNKKVLVAYFCKKILSKDRRRLNLYLLEDGFYPKDKVEKIKTFFALSFLFYLKIYF